MCKQTLNVGFDLVKMIKFTTLREDVIAKIQGLERFKQRLSGSEND